MKLKSTISESEKNRILGLHNNYKNILNEDSGHEEAMHYGSDEGHDDKELDALKSHMDSLEDDMHYDHIHDDYDIEENKMYDAARREHPEFPWDDPIEDHEYSKVDHSDRDKFDGRKSRVIGVDSDIKNQRKEMGEMVIPQGWTMKTPTELEEEAAMDDLYEIWSGKEDRDALIREMNMTKETVYELPARFGKKRLTESQLINMINTITK